MWWYRHWIISRSHEELSLPIQPDELTKQLDLWANVKFDFDSPENAAGGQLASLEEDYSKAFGFEDAKSYSNKRQKYDFEAALAGIQSAAPPGTIAQQIDPLSNLFKETPAPVINSKELEALDDEEDNEDKIIRRRRFKKLPMPPVQQRDGETYEQAKKRTEKEHKDAETAAKRELEEDKRRRNTAASARFRVKKKAREAALEQTANEYKGRVEQLEKEVGDLKRENGWLRGLIINSNNRS